MQYQGSKQKHGDDGIGKGDSIVAWKPGKSIFVQVISVVPELPRRNTVIALRFHVPLMQS